MKGPYQRMKFDMRRLWECPVCRHRAFTPGTVTSLLCRCQESVEPRQRRFMCLLEAATPTRGTVATQNLPAAEPLTNPNVPALGTPPGQPPAAASTTMRAADGLPSPD